MASNITYKQTKQGSNVSSLSIAHAPKAKDTRVATQRVQVPKSWEETLLPTLIDTGIKGYSAHLDNNFQRAKLANANVVNELNAKETAYDMAEYDAIKYGDAKTQTKAKAENSKMLKLTRTQNSYSEHMLNLESMDGIRDSERAALISDFQGLYTKRVKKQQQAVYEETKQFNTEQTLSEFNTFVMPRISEGSFKFSDLQGYKQSLKAWGYSESDASKALVGVVKDNIHSFRFNNGIIQDRYNEAKELYNDYIKKDKKFPDGFIDYYGSLTKYKATLDIDNTRQLNREKATIVDTAKKTAAEIEYTVSEIPPVHINMESLLEDNIGNTLAGVKESLRQGVYASELTKAGVTGIALEKKLDSYSKKVLAKTALTHWTATIGGHPNVDTIPEEYRPDLVTDIKRDVSWAIENNQFGVLNEAAAGNMKTVRPLITKHINGLQKQLLSDPENYQRTKQQIDVFMQGIDGKHINLKGNDLLKYNIMKNFNQDKYIEASSRIDSNEKPTTVSTFEATSGIFFTDKVKLEEFPLADQKEIKGYLALEKFVTGENNEDDFIARFKQTNLGDFRVSQNFLNNYPDDTVLKNVNLDIPEGSHINMRADGLIRITKGGATLRTFTKRGFDKLYNESADAILLKKKIDEAASKDTLLDNFLNLFQ